MSLRMLRVLLALALTLPLAAQKKELTLEAIYDPETKVAIGGTAPSGFEWIDDDSFTWPLKNERGEFVEWRVFDARSGATRKLAIAAEDVTFNAKHTAGIVTKDDELDLVNAADGSVKTLTKVAGEEEVPSFSPDGTKVAFVRNNDLYVVDLDGNEKRLTTDGSSEILNGKLDWVYQEEVYGRGTWKSYWWSPDSSRIAFLQLDEREVPKYTIVDEIPLHPNVTVYPYPKAGDPNPKVKLLVVSVADGAIRPIDLSRYRDVQPLVVNVAWNKDAVVYQVQNREQTWLDLVTASSSTGESRVLIHETTPAWVDPLANPIFLPDGSFLWQSERTGYRHVYHYQADPAQFRRITNGEWEVRDVHGADKSYVYFSGTERSVLGQDIYRIRFDGTGLQRLSERTGTHNATFNPSFSRFIDKWSDVDTPDQARLYANDGKLLRAVDENRGALYTQYNLPKIEFLQVKTRDGVPMEAMMIRPTHFDPSKKYPVYQYVYGGPHAQSVRNTWGGQRYLFHRYVAQQGAIVWIVDNRTASGKGAVSAWPAHKNLGELELRDLEDALVWLKQQPYIDGSRVLMTGWSNGGFITLYTLTHSKSWSAGIAGGSVVDWRDYDSIFTERMMLEPRNNEEGYRKSAPLLDADKLHGNLLLLHGTADDNVHAQNTIQFAYELQKRERMFEMMLLPRSKHTVTAQSLYFMQKFVMEFVKRQFGI
jgi:dipeptidyl-peptidase-4